MFSQWINSLLPHELLRVLRIIPLTGLSVFSQCSEAQKKELPCWLQNPMVSPSAGQIGISRSIALGKLSGEELSRYRALESLCVSEGQSCSEELLLKALDEARLFDKTLYFASYQASGHIYSYAGFRAPDSGACAVRHCDLNACEPAWLCRPTLEDSVRLVGISYRMPNDDQQLQSAIENALIQAEYLYGVDIAADKSLTNAMFSTGETRMLSESDTVNFGERSTVPYRMLQQCRIGSTLLTHVEIDHDPQMAPSAMAPASKWRKQPKLNGVDGAVGAVERMVASGLLSDQIELAIRRGAVQLAFEKNSLVKEDRVQVSKSTGGVMFVSYVTEQTEVNLKVKVMQIHFEQHKSNALKVYAWVAAVN